MPDDDIRAQSLIFRAAELAAADQYTELTGIDGAEREARYAGELARLAEDATAPAALVRALFPAGVPLDTAFYTRLTQFRYTLGFTTSVEKVMTFASLAAMRGLGAADRETLLGAVTAPGHDFFTFHHLLREVVMAMPPGPDFAIRWFPALLTRLGNDMATGPVWGAIAGYCEAGPTHGLTVLERYHALADPDPPIDHLIQAMLGILRTLKLEQSDRQRFLAVETALENDLDPSRREVFLSSWAITTFRSGLSKETLARLCAKLPTAREKDHWFAVLSHILVSPKLGSETLHLAMAWLRDHASPDLTPNAKHRLVEAASFTGPDGRFVGDPLLDLWELILAVLPIAPERTATWNSLECVLSDMLRRDRAVFETRFTQLCERAARSILPLIRNGPGFQTLISQMGYLDWSDLVGRLVFSSSVLTRQVGLYFFQNLPVREFPKAVLDNVNATDLALTFCAFRIAPLCGEVVGRFLLAVLPRVLTEDTATQREYAGEFLLQCKNYHVACLEVFKDAKVKSPFMASVIKAADNYYSKLRRTEDTALNAMKVPSLESIARSKRRALDREIREGSERNSVLMQVVKKVDMIYGERFSSFREGALSEPTATQQHRFEIEIPRLEEIDPEALALRRWRSMEFMSRWQEHLPSTQ
jgi:hypothetical protein